MLAQHGCSVVQVVEVAVVEADQHRLLRKGLPLDVVVEHGIQVDGRVTELAQLIHLLVEERDGHGQRITREIIDLVVHQHAKAPVPVAVRAQRDGRLADRPVDGVLQHLLEAVGSHELPSLVAYAEEASMGVGDAAG